ncbi:MAG: hypothetical protein HQK79_00930 [Desulfobacterales bacterium]|nr:hypothetical protein [Desulfobacterales bacterium]
MSLKYDLKKIMMEVREDEEEGGQAKKVGKVSQDDIKKLLAKKRKGETK